MMAFYNCNVKYQYKTYYGRPMEQRYRYMFYDKIIITMYCIHFAPMPISSSRICKMSAKRYDPVDQKKLY